MTPSKRLLPHERRTSKRQRCQPFVSLTILVRPKMQKYQVTIHDVCHTCLGFLADVPLQPGTVLALQRQIYAPGLSWIRSGKVTHATPHGEKWLVGCVLSPPFSDSELTGMAENTAVPEAP